MIMKRILYYIWILPLMLSGCEKDLMDYEGLEGVYFAVQWGDSWGSEKTWPYQPYTNVNFISLPGDTATLSVKVMATGPVKTYDRIFLVEVNPDSTDLTENVDYLRDAVISGGGLERSTLTMNQYLDRARELLTVYPESPYRRSLLDLCDYIAERDK